MEVLNYTFITPTMIESANSVLKKHWAVRHRFREALAKELCYLTLEAKRGFDELMAHGLIAPDWKTTVRFTTFRRRKLDKDNSLFRGTLKPWIDSIVEIGFARGDTTDLFDYDVIQVPVKHKVEEGTGIEITIY
jgi:hypothetical protein